MANTTRLSCALDAWDRRVSNRAEDLAALGSELAAAVREAAERLRWWLSRGSADWTVRMAAEKLLSALSSPAAPAKVRLPDDVIRGARNLDGVEIADAGGNCTHVSCSSDTCDVCGTRGVWGNGPAARGGE